MLHMWQHVHVFIHVFIHMLRWRYSGMCLILSEKPTRKSNETTLAITFCVNNVGPHFPAGRNASETHMELDVMAL